MYKKILLLLALILFSFVVSCNDKDNKEDNINNRLQDDEYITKIVENNSK
ncbi:hypothetical protein [Brachyspira pilosicoli]|nr:hypothetical protein [Brachyspira pilosicoli]